MTTPTADRPLDSAERGTASRAAAANRWRALATVALFGPTVFGVTSAAVALSAMAADLGVGPVAAGWVLTIHALFLGAGAAVSGRLCDVIGVRRVLYAGAGLLAAGTLAVLAAGPFGLVIAGRAVLATGSGAMVATALALNAAVPEQSRARALGRFGMGIALFASAATAAGGLTATLLSWRAALVLPVLSALAVAPASRLAGSGRPGGRLDVTGAAAALVAAGGLVVLVQAHALRLGSTTIAGIAAAVTIGLAATIRRGRTRLDAFVPVGLFARVPIRRVTAVGGATYGGFFATVLLVPRGLAAHGASVLEVGLILLPAAIVAAVVSRLTARPARGGTATIRRAAAVLAAVELGFAAAAAAAWLTSGIAVALVTVSAFGFAAFAVTQVLATSVVGAGIAGGERGAALGVLNLAFFVSGSAGAAAAAAVADVLGIAATLGVVAALPGVAAFVAARLGRP